MGPVAYACGLSGNDAEYVGPRTVDVTQKALQDPSSPHAIVWHSSNPLSMTSIDKSHARILVVGATGVLGSEVVRNLLAAGHTVRAFGRRRAQLDLLAGYGAETVCGDLRDTDAISHACTDVGQLLTSANGVAGRGADSPHRVELLMHRNLCDAAKRHAVRRIVYVSGVGMGGASSPVDIFRLKHETEELIKQSGVPYVLLRPTLFMDMWVGTLLGDSIRDKGVVTLFGDGNRVANFIAVRDLAEFARKVLEREEIRNTVVSVGGPSTMSFNEIVTIVERELAVTAKRRHVPVFVLRAGMTLLRPFNEFAARLMALGYFSATRATTFNEWRESAERFGVSPMTVEAFAAERYGRMK